MSCFRFTEHPSVKIFHDTSICDGRGHTAHKPEQITPTISNNQSFKHTKRTRSEEQPANAQPQRNGTCAAFTERLDTDTPQKSDEPTMTSQKMNFQRPQQVRQHTGLTERAKNSFLRSASLRINMLLCMYLHIYTYVFVGLCSGLSEHLTVADGCSTIRCVCLCLRHSRKKRTPGWQSTGSLKELTQCAAALTRQSLARCSGAPPSTSANSKARSHFVDVRSTFTRSACASSSTTCRSITLTSASDLEVVRVGGARWLVRGARPAEKRLAMASARTLSCEELAALI